jgi:hypothetical protein
MEKIQIEKDSQNKDYYERVERQEQQRADYLYRQKFGMQEFEMEQEEEERELARLAEQEEELERLINDPEEMEQSERSDHCTIAFPVPPKPEPANDQDESPDPQHPKPEAQPPMPAGKRAYDWQSRLREITDPEAVKKEEEEWDKLEAQSPLWKLKENDSLRE